MKLGVPDEPKVDSFFGVVEPVAPTMHAQVDSSEHSGEPVRLKAGAVVSDRFVIERLAGSGGMGTVYRALDRLSGAPVALKVLTRWGEHEQRFAQEARMLAELNHPAIVRYVAHGETAHGQPYLAMQWLDGEDLEMRLARSRLTVGESLDVARRVAAGLAAVHERGVVHRDVKPSNVFLVDGALATAKLLDFGIARLEVATSSGHRMTRTGIVLGTVAYMSPEQATADETLDARTDVFSLGCVLFECLTGRAAFTGAHVVAVLAKILREQAPRMTQLRPDLPQSLDDLVARMLSKNKALRPANGRAVLDELDALGTIASSAPLSGVPSSAGLSGGEQRLVTVMLALVPHESDRVRELVGSFGGQLSKLANGVLLITLGARGAASDQVISASGCALALRQAFPGARIALALGRAQTLGSERPDPVIDRAAALLADSKSPGIRIDNTTAGLLGARFEVLEDSGAYTLVAQLVEVEAPRTLLGKTTPCVGRDRELALLEATLRECIDDSVARAVLVTAPAGQGKSRLRHEFMHTLRDGGYEPLVLIARGDPVGAGSAFALTRQLMRQAMGLHKNDVASDVRAKVEARLARIAARTELDWLAEFVCELLGAPFTDDASPTLRSVRNDPAILAEWLRRAFVAWLDAECVARPLLLVLEDVHWGDQPSLVYLGEALRQLSERPLMLLALARPDVHDAFPNLWAGAMLEVPLPVLSRRATERLVHAVLPDIAPETMARIVDRAAGNAFYVEELIRRVAEDDGDDLPETVIALAQSRIERLEPEPRRILRAASILGEVFWTGGITALLGTSSEQAGIEAWLGALVDRELVVPGRAERLSRGQEYTFRHGLLREVAYSMLTDADRATGHGLAGEWLERAGETDAMTLAGHYERGGELARAVPWFLRATQTALNGGDVDAVVHLGNRGISCNPNDADKGLLRVAQAHAMGSRGDWAAVVEFGLEGMRLLPVASTPWFLCASGVFIAGAFLGDPSLTAQLLPTMMDESVRPEPSVPYGTALVASCVALSVVGQVDLASSIVERAEATARTSDTDPAFVLRLLNARAYVQLVREDLGGGLRNLSEAHGLADRLGDAHGLALGSMQIVLYSVESGDFERAETVARECIAFSDRLGSTHYTGWNSYYLARAKVSANRAGEAVHLLMPLLDAKYSNMATYIRALLAYALVESGEAEAATRQATTVMDDGFMYPGAQIMAFAAMANLELARHRPESALDFIGRGLALSHASWPLERTILHLARACATQALGKKDEARAFVRDARDRVVRLAATLDEPALRNLCMTNVDANARTLAFAHEWLDGAKK
jgi:eukaryotic-like serine/threonine-protein kinase